MNDRHLNKPRILICGVLPPPTFGHSKTYEILINSEFANTFDIVFLNMHFWTYGQDRKVTVTKLLKLMYYYVKFIGLLVFKRPDYVLYNISFYKMPFLKDFLFCFTAWVFRRKYVLHDHGQYVRELYESCGGLRRALIRWLLRHCCASIVLGESARESYQDLMDLKKVFIVPGGVDDTRSIDVDIDREGRTINILFFSYMSEMKGIFTAIDAAQMVLSARDDIRFTFAGPMESENVEQVFEVLRNSNCARVDYLGYIDDPVEKARIFRSADIFIFSTLREAFGLALLHAMAEGLPIVASREGGVVDIIQDGENGFLCEKANAEEFSHRILQLIGDNVLRNKMSVRNREIYEQKYTDEKYGKRVIKTFYKIMESGH